MNKKQHRFPLQHVIQWCVFSYYMLYCNISENTVIGHTWLGILFIPPTAYLRNIRNNNILLFSPPQGTVFIYLTRQHFRNTIPKREDNDIFSTNWSAFTWKNLAICTSSEKQTTAPSILRENNLAKILLYKINAGKYISTVRVLVFYAALKKKICERYQFCKWMKPEIFDEYYRSKANEK